MISAGVTFLIFCTAFLVLFGINLVMTDIFQKERHQQKKRLEAQGREQSREQSRQQVKEKYGGRNLDELAAEAMKETADDQTLVDKIHQMLEQSGTQITMPKLLTFSVGSGAVFGLTIGFLMRSIPLGVMVGIATLALPLCYVKYKRQRRFGKMLDQLPDALELMSRTLRAGQTISQAMLGVGNEFREPLGPEFGYCYEQQNLGLSADVALRDIANRTGVLEIRIFVLGLLIHRRSGGNLTELLDNLAGIIRARHRMRGKVRALTAEGRLQGLILMVLPVVAFLGLLVVSRDYAMKLFDYPWLLIGCMISMGLGAVWIRKIVNFDF
jgi:tight adherence protein B